MKCENCGNKIEHRERAYELITGKTIGILDGQFIDTDDSLFMWCSKCEEKRKPLEFDNG